MAVEYLSDEWILAVDRLLAAVTLDPPIVGAPFTLLTRVIDGPDGTRAYVIEFGLTTARARSTEVHPAGTVETGTVSLTQSYAVAAEVARGDRDAQTAFLHAEIQVGGDVSRLIDNAATIAHIGDLLAPLRAETTYLPVGDSDRAVV